MQRHMGSLGEEIADLSATAMTSKEMLVKTLSEAERDMYKRVKMITQEKSE